MKKTIIVSALLYLVVEVSCAYGMYSNLNHNNYELIAIDHHIEFENNSNYRPTYLNKTKKQKNFKRSRVLAGFDLVLTSNETSSTTEILYHATCTEGLDPGWDAGAFQSEVPSFGIFTHLACDSSGVDFSIQVLSNNYNDKTVIPLSVYTPANSTISFNVNLNSGGFPTDRDIYIEDRETNTVQKISDSDTYQVTVTEKLNGGIGRFYLYTSKFVWLGTTDTDWDTASNWSTGSVPTIADDILIANVVNKPVASGTVDVNKMAIAAGSSLTVGGNLTINDMLTINSDMDLFGSLIVNGNSTGNITYNRYVTFNDTSTLGWHLVGSPVVGETIEDIIANGSLADGSSGDRKGLAIYNNDQNQAPFGSWVYQTTASTGTMNSGNGYSIKRNVAGKIPFTGTLKTDNLSSFPITVGSENRWNLIANPYLSSIKGNDSGSFLSENLNQLDPNAAAIYVWDSKAQSGTGEYKIINNSSSATNITPGQGFFVAAKSGGGSINITEAMQTHGLADLFLRNNNLLPHIKLNISDGNKVKSTDIKYSEDATKGLDIGYDAKVFDAVNSSKFGIYTHLVSDNQGVNFALQTLPNNKYEEMIIPIGINALLGTEVSFDANLIDFPEELHVFLEDRYNNVFTKLDNDSTYTITLKSDYSGIGRFYLHTTKREVFNENNTDLEYVSIYKTKNNTLKIVGLKNSNATLSIFNTLAKQVLQSSFLLNNVQDISLNNLAAGVYIVHLQTDYGKLHKKIILE